MLEYLLFDGWLKGDWNDHKKRTFTGSESYKFKLYHLGGFLAVELTGELE